MENTLKEEIFERCPYTTKEEWHKLRGKGIGGSDASIILGYSNWTTNNELWHQKVYGVVKDDSLEDNELVIYGKTTEEPLRRLFQAKFVDVLEVKNTDEVLVRKDKPYLRASLDGEISVINDFVFLSSDEQEYKLKTGMRGIWENKTAYMPPKDKWNKKIPMNYYCQILHYLMVTGYDFVIISVEITYHGGTSLIKHYCFMRKGREADLSFLERKEDEFWDMVENKIEPPLKVKF